MFEKLKAGLNGFVNKITTTELKRTSIEKILLDFKLTLVENDVAVRVAEHICMEIEAKLEGIQVGRLEDKKKLIKESMSEVLTNILKLDQKVDFYDAIAKKRALKAPFTIVFVGINGTGKTTSIAKLANLLRKKGFSVVLACSDTYRAGSIEQLGEHAKRLGTRVIKHTYGADPAAVAYDAVNYAKTHGINVVLIDTAGRIQTDKNLMSELGKIKRVINPDLTILTVDALTGNDAVMQAEEFNKLVGIDGTILTKVDADVKGGAALSVAYITKQPIIFIGTGQNYMDFQAFNPEKFVEMILK